MDRLDRLVTQVSMEGSTPWWVDDTRAMISTATQEQCQSSCSSGNGGCAPSKVALPPRQIVAADPCNSCSDAYLPIRITH